MFPKGWDGWGWSHVSRELSKALTFLEASVKAPFAGGASMDECLGKAGALFCLQRWCVQSLPSLSLVVGLWSSLRRWLGVRWSSFFRGVWNR
jgi:hypothetical protein